MKQHEGRNVRRQIVAVTLVVTLLAVGLLLKGFSQKALALAPAALDGSYKTTSAENVSPGGEVTYQIVLSNSNGSPVSNVVVTDELPAETTYVNNSVSYPQGQGISFLSDPGSRYFTFTVPSVASTPVTLSFRVLAAATLQADDVITNTAVISQGGIPLSRTAVVTVAAPPTARIDFPWSNQLITQRDVLTVRGRVWTVEQTPEFPGAPVLKDILYQPGRAWYLVDWFAVPGAISYILEEANNPQFTDAEEVASTSDLFHNITNQPAGTYYYQVKARNAYDDSFWSNVVSVTVTTSAFAAGGQSAAPAPAAASYQPGVEINIKPVGGADNWVPVTSVTAGLGDWWNWSYNWTAPQEDNVPYVIQVRGTDLAGSYDPALVDTVTVTLQNGTVYIYMPIITKRYPPVPYPPVIQVGTNDGIGNYQITWTYPHAQFTPTSYNLQESTDPNFGTFTVYTPTASVQAFTSKGVGHYYYRVRGMNSAGAGEWSNVVDVLVAGYFDDFSNAASGWPRKVEYINSRPVFDMNYENGSYRAKIMLNTTGANNYLMGIVRSPYDNTLGSYEVRVDHHFAKAGDQTIAPEWGKSGLIFAASSDYKTLYVVEWRYPDGWCAVSKYTGVDKPVIDVRAVIAGTGSIRAWGPCSSVLGGYDKINKARVIVNGSSASVYINDTLIRTFTDTGLLNAHKVGFLTGAYERTPVEGRFDNFQVTPR